MPCSWRPARVYCGALGGGSSLRLPCARPRPKLMLVDCHAHLHVAAFDVDRPLVLRRARQAGVAAVLVVGEDLEDSLRNEEVTSTAEPDGPILLPCFGLHPDRFADDRPLPTPAAIDAIKDLIRSAAPRLAAVGEVGLDRFYARSEAHRAAQAAALEELAALAIELDLPLNVHSRSAGHYTIDLLRAAGARRVLMHAFDGKPSHALRGAELGWVFSIPPSVV